jgi:hypothetical protein
MFRKLFKSEASVPDRGIDPDCVEFWMGHSNEIKGKGGIYDKTPDLYADMIEKEYAKLEPYLNIYSRTQPLDELPLTDSDWQDLKDMLSLMREGKLGRIA